MGLFARETNRAVRHHETQWPLPLSKPPQRFINWRTETNEDKRELFAAADRHLGPSALRIFMYAITATYILGRWALFPARYPNIQV